MRETSLVGSSRSPKIRHSVGQTITHAGSSLFSTRFAQKLHFSAVRVFDLYQGQGVPEGFKSLALEVQVQPIEQTLTDKDIEALSAKAMAAAEKLGAKLRG